MWYREQVWKYEPMHLNKIGQINIISVLYQFICFQIQKHTNKISTNGRESLINCNENGIQRKWNKKKTITNRIINIGHRWDKHFNQANENQIYHGLICGGNKSEKCCFFFVDKQMNISYLSNTYSAKEENEKTFNVKHVMKNRMQWIKWNE